MGLFNDNVSVLLHLEILLQFLLDLLRLPIDGQIRIESLESLDQRRVVVVVGRVDGIDSVDGLQYRTASAIPDTHHRGETGRTRLSS